MCGIAGVIEFDPATTVCRARLDRMRDTLRHRGPDGYGTWIEGGVGLGHRRLAIVDVAGGTQPMTSADGSSWIVFNGEIYNHPALKAALEQRGRAYRTRSDTETILHLYDEEGDRAVERLQGMFAFALWDRRRQRLLLARDRLGIKPLYYAVTDRELLFSSEIKAILAAGTVRPALNRRILPEYLATGFVSGEATFYEGIRKLLPGQTLAWTREGGLEQRQYWCPPVEARADAPPTLDAAAEDLRARLTETVRSHLMADVEVGLFLSGGIDSAGLAALMAPLLPDRLRTFSVGFTDPRVNELGYARLVADAVGSEHHTVMLSPGRFFNQLPRLVWHEDEPIAFPSSVPLHVVSALAREHVKVVLTGEGADELFCGYNRYRVTAWNLRLGRLYGRAAPAPARRAVARAIGALPWRLRRVASRTFLAHPADVRSLWLDNFAVFGERLQASILTGGAHDDTDFYRRAADRYAALDGSDVDRMTRSDLETYLVELLMKQDQMSMAASVESRVPFLDHALVEWALTLPPEYKLRGWRTKVVLRRALRDLLPPETLRRRKMGFPVPIGSWLRGPFASLVDEFVTGPRTLARGLFDAGALRHLVAADRAGRAEHGSRLWLLLNLEIWQRLAIDGEDVAAILAPVAPALLQEPTSGRRVA